MRGFALAVLAGLVVLGLAWVWKYRYGVGLLVKYPAQVDKVARTGSQISDFISAL